MINEITEEAEIGKVYHGVVKKIMDFGAFVEIIPGTDGLVHISELAHERVKNVTDVLKEGDEVDVKVLDVDRQGKIRLSRRVLLPVPEGMTLREPDTRPHRSDRDRRPGRAPKNRPE
jgi:polyribonucleotide nucleotidyltransferase